MYRDLHRANVISVGYGEKERESCSQRVARSTRNFMDTP